jgi:hypothetical protein
VREKGVGLIDPEAGLCRCVFVISRRCIGLHAGAAKRERNRAAGVRANTECRDVVGRNEHAAVVPGTGAFEARRDDSGVEVLDGANLEVKPALMTGLVRSFDMQVHEVDSVEGLKSGSHFAGVVGVQIARGPGHSDRVEAGADTDAVHKVDGTDDTAVDTETARVRLDSRGAALAPKPNRGYRRTAGGCTGRVHRVARE